MKPCGNERPLRKAFCQLKKGHKGSHQAVIFWEDEKKYENLQKEKIAVNIIKRATV